MFYLLFAAQVQAVSHDRGKPATQGEIRSLGGMRRKSKLGRNHKEKFKVNFLFVHLYTGNGVKFLSLNIDLLLLMLCLLINNSCKTNFLPVPAGFLKILI